MLLPAELLRAVIRFAPADPEGVLAENLQKLRAEIEPEGIDQDILVFVGELVDRSQTVPSLALTLQHYQKLQDKGDGRGAAGVTRLELVADPLPDLLSGADFRYALDQHKEEVLRSVLGQTLMDASTILTTGLVRTRTIAGRLQKQTLEGGDQAITYLQESLHDLHLRLKRGALEGSIRQEAGRVMAAYEARKRNPGARIGVLTGISELDRAHKGLQRGEFALVAGFTSHLKSTFCLNWCYQAVVNQGLNVALVSLESPIDVMRLSLFVLHSVHPKFTNRYGFTTLDFEKVQSGLLDAAEERLWRDVVEDFEQCADYGQLLYKEPGAITLAEVQQWAEGVHRMTPLDLLVVDYLGHVDVPGLIERQGRLNHVLRGAKQLAGGFANGRGVALVSPHQINRDGLKEAEKTGGKYTLRALADSNEAERSPDIIYTVYLDDALRVKKEVTMGNLKARNLAVLTSTFQAFADPSTRLIQDLNLSLPNQQRTIPLASTAGV